MKSKLPCAYMDTELSKSYAMTVGRVDNIIIVIAVKVIGAY